MILPKLSRILIVEDICEVSEWISRCLKITFNEAQIESTHSWTEAFEKLRRFEPDLALVDLGLPDGCGIELIRHIKSVRPDCRCVVLSVFDDQQHLFNALRAGADGYLIKSESQEGLNDALLSLLSGNPPLSPSVARKILNHFHIKNDSSVDLTCREEEVLILIANGYSAAATATSLGLSVHTVTGYIKSLYQKLQVSNRAEVTLKAINLGLIDPT